MRHMQATRSTRRAQFWWLSALALAVALILMAQLGPAIHADAPSAYDTFTRANQSGWGTADSSFSWDTAGSSAFSIASDQGVATYPSSTAVQVADAGDQGYGGFELMVFKFANVSHSYLSMVLNDSINDFNCGGGTNNRCRYELRLDAKGQKVSIYITHANSTVQEATASFTFSANTLYDARFDYDGSDYLDAKVWQHSTTEPSSWTLQFGVSNALRAPEGDAEVFADWPSTITTSESDAVSYWAYAQNGDVDCSTYC